MLPCALLQHFCKRQPSVMRETMLYFWTKHTCGKWLLPPKQGQRPLPLLQLLLLSSLAEQGEDLNRVSLRLAGQAQTHVPGLLCRLHRSRLALNKKKHILCSIKNELIRTLLMLGISGDSTRI